MAKKPNLELAGMVPVSHKEFQRALADAATGGKLHLARETFNGKVREAYYRVSDNDKQSPVAMRLTNGRSVTYAALGNPVTG